MRKALFFTALVVGTINGLQLQKPVKSMNETAPSTDEASLKGKKFKTDKLVQLLSFDDTGDDKKEKEAKPEAEQADSTEAQTTDDKDKDKDSKDADDKAKADKPKGDSEASTDDEDSSSEDGSEKKAQSSALTLSQTNGSCCPPEPKPCCEEPKPCCDKPNPCPSCPAPKPCCEEPKPCCEEPKPCCEEPKPCCDKPNPCPSCPPSPCPACSSCKAQVGAEGDDDDKEDKEATDEDKKDDEKSKEGESHAQVNGLVLAESSCPSCSKPACCAKPSPCPACSSCPSCPKPACPTTCCGDPLADVKRIVVAGNESHCKIRDFLQFIEKFDETNHFSDFGDKVAAYYEYLNYIHLLGAKAHFFKTMADDLQTYIGCADTNACEALKQGKEHFVTIADMTLADIDALKCFLTSNVCANICMEEVHKELDALRCFIEAKKNEICALSGQPGEAPCLPPAPTPGGDGYDDIYGYTDVKKDRPRS